MIYSFFKFRLKSNILIMFFCNLNYVKNLVNDFRIILTRVYSRLLEKRLLKKNFYE